MSKYKIVLDAGHGGKDPGAVNNNLQEKDLNLSYILKVGRKLEQSGHYEVVYTRKSDKHLELHERSKLANNTNADAFVSGHINAANDKKAQGYETFSYPTSAKGARLAKDIHDSIIGAKLYTKNRGTKTANFAVLRQTKMPAALIELGFITNKEDVQLMTSKEDEFVEAIVKGINKYFGVKELEKDDIKGHWAEKQINKVITEGVMIGDEKGFRPDEPVTRAELAVVLSRLLEKK